MAASVQSRNDLLALLAPGRDGGILPEDLRSLLVSRLGCYAGLYKLDAAYSPGPSFTRLDPDSPTAFDSDDIAVDTDDCQLTIGTDGVYLLVSVVSTTVDASWCDTRIGGSSGDIPEVWGSKSSGYSCGFAQVVPVIATLSAGDTVYLEGKSYGAMFQHLMLLARRLA